MTIIKPHKTNNYLRFLFLIFALGALGGGIYIFEYNSLVNIKNQIESAKKEIVELQIQNADLKNNLYQILDTAKLENLALEKQLVLEKNPEYFNTKQWASGLSF